MARSDWGAPEPIAGGAPHLEGVRVPVKARDRDDAIRIAQTKAWWTKVKNPDRPQNIRGRFWFVLADAPISGLAELARTAKKKTDLDDE